MRRQLPGGAGGVVGRRVVERGADRAGEILADQPRVEPLRDGQRRVRARAPEW